MLANIVRNIRWRFFTTTLVLVLILLSFIYTLHPISFSSSSASLSTPDAIMTHIYAVQINKNGARQNILKSPRASHYAENDTTIFDAPYFIAYRPKQPAWHIFADHGKAIHGNEQIQLWNNVHIIEPPGPGSKNVTFLTEHLLILPQQSWIETADPVTIQQPTSIIHAVGLHADLNKGYIKLLSQAEGQYGTE